MSILLRMTTLSELSDIVQMEGDAENGKWIDAYGIEKHREVFTQDDTRYLSIVDDGEICGFVLLIVNGKTVEFRRIVVTKKGLGIGQTAIRQMEQYCKTDLQANRIWLDVYEFNERGRHIYEKLGYEFEQTIPGQHGTLLVFGKSINDKND